MLAAHPWPIFAVHAAVIANVAPAIRLGVGVDDLAPESVLRNAEPVIVMYRRGRIYYERDQIAIARFSQERHHAVVGIVEIDPVKPVVGVVLVPQGTLVFVGVV